MATFSSSLETSTSSISTSISSYANFITLPNNKKLKVCNMTPGDMDEIVQLISLNFATFNPLYYHLRVPKSDVIKYFRRIIERSLNENNAFKVFDIETNKIVGASIHYDLYYAQVNPIDSSGLHPKIYEIRKMHEALGPKMYPKKPGAILCTALTAIHPDFYGFKIVEKIGQFFWEEHPTQSLYPIVYAITTSSLSTKMCISAAYKRYKVYHPKDYVNQKGERPFETVDETAKKLGVRDYEGVTIVLRENYLRPKL